MPRFFHKSGIHRNSNGAAANNASRRNRTTDRSAGTVLGLQGSRVNSGTAALSASQQNRGRGELTSEAVRDRDIHNRFVRRPARGIRNDRATGAAGYTVAADRDTINLYYGAADSSTALALGSI